MMGRRSQEQREFTWLCEIRELLLAYYRDELPEWKRGVSGFTASSGNELEDRIALLIPKVSECLEAADISTEVLMEHKGGSHYNRRIPRGFSIEGRIPRIVERDDPISYMDTRDWAYRFDVLRHFQKRYLNAKNRCVNPVYVLSIIDEGVMTYQNNAASAGRLLSPYKSSRPLVGFLNDLTDFRQLFVAYYRPNLPGVLAKDNQYSGEAEHELAKRLTSTAPRIADYLFLVGVRARLVTNGITYAPETGDYTEFYAMLMCTDDPEPPLQYLELPKYILNLRLWKIDPDRVLASINEGLERCLRLEAGSLTGWLSLLRSTEHRKWALQRIGRLFAARAARGVGICRHWKWAIVVLLGVIAFAANYTTILCGWKTLMNHLHDVARKLHLIY